MDTIFVEINPITHNKDTYHWIYNLVEQYSKEVKDRGGKVKVVSEDWYSVSGSYEHVVLEIIEENALNNFKEREGKQRLSKVPVFATPSSTKVTGYQTLSIKISIYPEVLNDFELKPSDVTKDVFRLPFPDIEEVVEVTHKPTNIKVQCKQERTKKDNELMALRILKAKVYKTDEESSASKIST